MICRDETRKRADIGARTGMNSLRHASFHLTFAAVAAALFSAALFIPASLLAEESAGTFIPSSPASWNVSLPAGHTSQQVSSIDSGAFLFVDTGRASMFNRDFRATDTRRDITSVDVVPVTMSDAGVPSGREHYWETAETNTAVLSRDSGNTHLHLESAGKVADVSTSRTGERAGAPLVADDFLGHTREYLQTRN